MEHPDKIEFSVQCRPNPYCIGCDLNTVRSLRSTKYWCTIVRTHCTDNSNSTRMADLNTVSAVLFHRVLVYSCKNPCKDNRNYARMAELYTVYKVCGDTIKTDD